VKTASIGGLRLKVKDQLAVAVAGVTTECDSGAEVSKRGGGGGCTKEDGGGKGSPGRVSDESFSKCGIHDFTTSRCTRFACGFVCTKILLFVVNLAFFVSTILIYICCS